MVSLLSLAACGPQAAPDGAETVAPAEHDFGVIPHGEQRQHTFPLLVPGGPAGYVAAGFRSGCTCGQSSFMVRRADGSEHSIDSLPYDQRELREGDQLLLELTLDTAREEATDHPTATVRGLAVLERAAGGARLELPVIYHFAIDAPVEVRPAVHVDIGALPRSRSYSQSLALEVDPKFAPITFGAVETSHPRLEATLRESDGRSLLDLRFAPGAEDPTGPMQMAIRVATDMPNGYVLQIPVSGTVTADITIEPFDHISFGRFDLQTTAERFVNVFDHRLDREPGFVVHAILDNNGSSLADHFEVQLQPVDGSPRCTRMFLRYLGTWEHATFRGVVRLAKPDGSPGPDITFVGFHKES